MFFPFRVDTVIVLDHTKCEGKIHLSKEQKRVEELGGEGLMIRKPKSTYVNGRSNTLLKIKTFHDAEVKTIFTKRCQKYIALDQESGVSSENCLRLTRRKTFLQMAPNVITC